MIRFHHQCHNCPDCDDVFWYENAYHCLSSYISSPYPGSVIFFFYLQDFLSRTSKLSQSAQLATATLDLLMSTLSNASATLQAADGLANTWHRCAYCDQLQPQVAAALRNLEAYLLASPVATQRALEGVIF